MKETAKAFDDCDWRSVVIMTTFALASERSSLSRAFYARLLAWASHMIKAGAFYNRQGD